MTADLIGVEERVEQLVALVHESSHVIAEDVVEADMAKAKLLMALPQLPLPVRAQGQGGVPAPNRMLPEMR
jgi:hypothetical protein